MVIPGKMYHRTNMEKSLPSKLQGLLITIIMIIMIIMIIKIMMIIIITIGIIMHFLLCEPIVVCTDNKAENVVIGW